MKSLLKFTLLSALIISGRLVKDSAPVSVARTAEPVAKSSSSVLLVHQVLTSEPVQPAREQNLSQQSGSGLITDMF